MGELNRHTFPVCDLNGVALQAFYEQEVRTYLHSRWFQFSTYNYGRAKSSYCSSIEYPLLYDDDSRARCKSEALIHSIRWIMLRLAREPRLYLEPERLFDVYRREAPKLLQKDCGRHCGKKQWLQKWQDSLESFVQTLNNGSTWSQCSEYSS